MLFLTPRPPERVGPAAALRSGWVAVPRPVRKCRVRASSAGAPSVPALQRQPACAPAGQGGHRNPYRDPHPSSDRGSKGVGGESQKYPAWKAQDLNFDKNCLDARFQTPLGPWPLKLAPDRVVGTAVTAPRTGARAGPAEPQDSSLHGGRGGKAQWSAGRHRQLGN